MPQADVSLDNTRLNLDGDRVVVGTPPQPGGGQVVFPAELTVADVVRRGGPRFVADASVIGRELVSRNAIVGPIAQRTGFEVHLPAEFDDAIKVPDVLLRAGRGYQSLIQRLLGLETQVQAMEARIAALEAAAGGGGGGP